MINLGYGKIDEVFFDKVLLGKQALRALEKAKLTSYSTPGGNEETKRAILKYLGLSNDLKMVATAVSTNLAFSICVELFSTNIHIFTPLFSNYFLQFKRMDSRRVIVHEYSELITGFLNTNEINEGDLAIILLPSNPTGELPARDRIIDVVRIFNQRKASILFDLSWFESMKGLRGYEIKDFSNFVREMDAIVLLGFTKITGLSGIRCSGILGSEERISAFVKRHDELAISCGSFDEAMLVETLNGERVLDWGKLRKHTCENYLALCKALSDSGMYFNVKIHEAGIFAYFSIEGNFKSEIIYEECKNDGVLVYPSTFFEDKSNGFRVNLGCEQVSFNKGLEILLSHIRSSL